MLIGHRDQIAEAMSSDFGVHPSLAADLIEVLGPAGRAAYAAEQLRTWMAPEPRRLGPGAVRLRARVRAAAAEGRDREHRPVELPLRPVGRAARRDARCRQPRRDQAVRVHARLRRAAPADDPLHVRPPNASTSSSAGSSWRARSRAFAGTICCTPGSPAIGREIAKAAAEQLVPVTLELGGKCPAILTCDSVDAESVKQILGTKALKNGQMCISVDYCLVPRDAAGGVRSARRGPRARADARLLHLGELHRDHLRPPPAADREAARRRRGPPAPTCARSNRRRPRLTPMRASCRCRSCSTRPTSSG